MFCTYVTEYFGDKMPSKYVGSSSVDAVENGYRGSVSSEKYKEIWKSEIKNNPQLFRTTIITIHHNREEALEEELKIQLLNDVVKSAEWINESLAQPNGFFGRDVSGENNPMFGKTHSNQTIEKLKNSGTLFGYGREGKRGYHGEESTRKMVETRRRNGSYSHTEESKKKISENSKGDNNGNAKPIIFRGIEYGSIKSCSKATNLSPYKIRKEMIVK